MSGLKERLERTHSTNADRAEETMGELTWAGMDLAALVEPIDPSRIKTRTEQGRTYSYIEGHDVIDTANRIFGFGGWSYRVESLESREFTRTRTNRDTGEVTDTEILLYHATVTVSVGDVHRTDVGVGTSANDKPDAHETAIKGACTDGLKRAFRTFGAQFGNSLYDKAGGGGDSRPVNRPQSQNRRPASKPKPMAAPPDEGSADPDAEPFRLDPIVEKALRERLAELGVTNDHVAAYLGKPMTHKHVDTWLNEKPGRSVDMLVIGARDKAEEAKANGADEAEDGRFE